MKCGHVSTDNARFCAQCGAALLASGTPPPAAAGGPTKTAASAAPPHADTHAAGAAHSTAASAADTAHAAGLGTGMPPPTADPAFPHAGDADNAADTQNKQFIWLFASIAALATVALAIWLHGLYRESTEITISLAPAHPDTPSLAQAPPPATPQVVHVDQAAAVPAADTTPAPAVARDAPAAPRRSSTPRRKPREKVAVAPIKEAPATPRIAEPASEPRKPARTLDQVFRDRGASECEDGLSGLICREKLRFKLCEGRWTTRPPPGQSICHQPENNFQE